MKPLLPFLWTLVLAIAMPLGPSEGSWELPTELSSGQVLLTLYSLRGPVIAGITAGMPGRKAWYGHLWLNHRKIAFISYGQFLTLKLPGDDYSLAGQTAFGHEGSVSGVISLHSQEHYFVRLAVESKAVVGFGPMHYIGEKVSCQEAYREAATMEPVKLKRVEKSSLEQVVRESYFPECEK